MKLIPCNIKKTLSTKFSTKLFITLFFCVIVPLSFILTVNYYRSTQLSKEQAVYSNEKILNQAAAFLEYKVSSLKSIIDLISTDSTVQTALKTSNSYYRESQGNWFIQTTDIKNIIYNSYNTSDIKSIRLYLQHSSGDLEDALGPKQSAKKQQNIWNERLDNVDLLGTLWIPSSAFDPNATSPYISIIKRIPDFNSINKYIGIIKGDIPSTFFQQIVDQAMPTPKSIAILFNSYDEIISSAGDNASIQVEIVKNILKENNILNNGTLSEVTHANKDYLVGSYGMEFTDWTLVMIVPSADILASSAVYRYQIIYIALFLILLLIPVLYFTSYSLTKRIRRLKQHMKQATNNNFQISSLQNGNDEIGELTVSFNKLVKKNKILLDQQYQHGYEIKNLELKVLQSLINPHFLYNTLDMIYWLSVENNVPSITAASNSLAQFYKLSLNNGEDFVTLQNELNHAHHYVDIQNMRFDNKIILKQNIKQELLTNKILKIILQPLVENSILHGIRERKDESGTIYIKARLKNNFLIITVADNGIGMSEATLQSLVSKSNNTGYGVWNINQRIQLCYGQQYGLSYISKRNKGTCVIIKLPINF